MKHLFFLFILISNYFIISNAENKLEPRGHSSGIDPPPSGSGRQLIAYIINEWHSRQSLNLNHPQTVFRHPDNRNWRLDLQGFETHQVQPPGQLMITQAFFERYAIQGGPDGSETFAVVHIQRGIEFSIGIIRNAFEQSMASRSHVFLTSDNIAHGLNFPVDENQYISERIHRRINGREVWRIIWGTAAVVGAMHQRFHIIPTRKGLWKRGDEEDENSWNDVAERVMKKCIGNNNENNKIAKNAFNKLKEIYPDYRIFVGVYDYIEDKNKHDAIKSKVDDNVYKENINGKNYVVFRFDNSQSAETLKKIIRNLKRFAENHKFDELSLFVDLMIGEEYSFTFVVHDKADLSTSHDTDSVIIYDQGGYNLWIGLEYIKKPKV
uniref:Uncharacterized protein n=1 Tax=Panagrolaimus davidi TaxID=227884 RepID=A0A914PN46_9BILA